MFWVKFKKALLDELWLVISLILLIVLAVLGVKTYIKSHQESAILSEQRILISEAQLPAVELAKIVAKPLDELMAIRVYFDSESSLRDNELVASVDNDFWQYGDSEALLTYPVRRPRVKAMTNTVVI